VSKKWQNSIGSKNTEVQPFITLRKAEDPSLAAYIGIINKHDLSGYFSLL
jgi:hypothetical protein